MSCEEACIIYKIQSFEVSSSDTVIFFFFKAKTLNRPLCLKTL